MADSTSYLSGSVASSAAMVKSSLCRSRSRSFTRWSLVMARAKPITETASSVIP